MINGPYNLIARDISDGLSVQKGEKEAMKKLWIALYHHRYGTDSWLVASDGDILIAKEDPANPEYQLAMDEKIRKECTVNQNFNWIRLGILRHLPVLSIR